MNTSGKLSLTYAVIDLDWPCLLVTHCGLRMQSEQQNVVADGSAKFVDGNDVAFVVKLGLADDKTGVAKWFSI